MITIGGKGVADEFYGDKAFKCSNIACFYFHEGFANNEDRAEHSCQKYQRLASAGGDVRIRVLLNAKALSFTSEPYIPEHSSRSLLNILNHVTFL